MSRKSHHDRSHDSNAGNYGGGRMFNVSVVGLSGTAKDKGCLGVGKSCLCNRFIRPQADEYNRDHISILSQADFSGPIVNNEHWLYWGTTRKCTEEGFELTFNVVEQTEFVDDACFQPFKSGKTIDPYWKRCAATRLNSSEKLMYICKNQLGIEKEYEQHYLPDGRFNVDGFICVFDVSEIQERSIEKQVETTALILSSLLKTKKPVVLATTKNDEASDINVREAEKLVSRREFKGLIPLVETSSHDNVNVDLAFWACVQRDWAKGKTKIVSYREAFQRQRDRLEIVNDAYLTLIRSNITDYRTHWNNTYSNLSQSQDFITYCDLFGQESAQQTFKRHVKKLKEEYVCRKIDMYLRRLPKIFSEMLPDLDSFGPDQSWPSVQQILHEHPLFNNNFVLNESLSWQEMDDSSETRIPFDLLQTPEAEKAFFDHLSSLLAEEHLRNLRYQFSELLRETSVVPGQPLKEIRDSLKDRDCCNSLPESELKMIYDEYQKILQQDARDQLNELFLERAPLFLQFASGVKMITPDDLASISHELSKDERWLTLDLLPQDRQLALIRHLGFLQWPIKEHCYAGQACVDLIIEAYHSSLAKRNSRNPLWNQDLDNIQIKFVVMGSSAYAENLNTVVKAMCPSLEQENPRIHYETQIIHSNTEQSSLGIFPFRPYTNQSSQSSEAYLCVYSSRGSLEFIMKTLEHSLLTDLQYGNIHQTGLPLVLLLACTPDTSAKERNYLREEGVNRAQCLQCAFFDVTSNEPHARFKSDELLRALIFLSETLIRRYEMNHLYGGASSVMNNPIPEGALNPEIRILISLMCGDPVPPGRFLESLILFDSLPNTNFYPVSDHSFVTDVGLLMLSLENHENQDIDLNNVPSCYVEFAVSSYHSSYAHKEELFHGNILVYWSKRQASFSNMSALASVTSTIMPIQILALVENELRPSKLSHQLVAKGQELADQLQAHFGVSTLGAEMGKCVSAFLNYSLRNKHMVEKNLHITTSTGDGGAVIGENFEQPSPHSGISSEECFDPNMVDQENFDQIMAQQHPLNSIDCEQSKLLPEGIYERLPDQQSKSGKNPSPSFHQQFSPQLVRPTNRGDGHMMKKMERYSPDELDLHGAGESDGQPFFSPVYNSNNEVEHLLKPSDMIRQRRQHLNSNINNNTNNYYHNLQSYPSADSLDRIYAMDSNYQSHYYMNTAIPQPTPPPLLPPAHYLYRSTVHNRSVIDNVSGGGVGGNFSHIIDPRMNIDDQLPPRPASSAHVVIPRHHHFHPHHNHHSQEPPPYSRVAISPPPAYRMQQRYSQFSEISPSHQSPTTSLSQIYSNYHSQENLEQIQSPQPNTLAYYQRKYYPHIGGGGSGGHPMYSTFRNHHLPFHHHAQSPFNPIISNRSANDSYEKSLIHQTDPGISVGRSSIEDFKHSPLIYATTGRHHFYRPHQYHSRSPHFHQQQSSKLSSSSHHSTQLRNLIQPNVPLGSGDNNQERGGSSSLQRYQPNSSNSGKKKKKKHFSKNRSSSLSHPNEANDEDDGHNYDNGDPDDNDANDEHSDADAEVLKNKKPLVRLRKKRQNDDHNRLLNRNKQILGDIPNIDNVHPTDKNENSQKQQTKLIEFSIEKSNLEEREKNFTETEKFEDNNNDDDDENNSLLVATGDEQSVSESSTTDTSANDNLNNATADKFAVVSGWAYHQNSKSTVQQSNSPSNRLPDQWPPSQQQQPNDENSTSSERSKAPGKIDMKKFNNLSDAIGRLNLHSPLGPTRSSNFDDSMKSKDHFLLEENVKGQQLGRRERFYSKHSSTKEVDSESETSESNNNNKLQSTELINLNERIKFNSLKPASITGVGSGIGQKKTSQRKLRVTPLPVAPPRLPPSSANSSNAVTPTSSGIGKSFTSFSSYEESQHDNKSSSNNMETLSGQQSLENNDDETNSGNLDVGESRRNRWHQFSKLFSLPADQESGISIDENSIEQASEDTTSHSTYLLQTGKGTSNSNINTSSNNNNNTPSNTNNNADKAKFLKSKSIGTFSELDKKSIRKQEKLEKKRIKEEERKNRKNAKDTSNSSNRSRSRSKGAAGSNGSVGVHSSLEDFAQANGNPVPLFIEKCTQFIEQEGLDMEGIYRVPGNRNHVDTLLLKFDENPDINIADLDIPVNAVATALKDFFLKRLPPIFPPDSMTDIANLAKQYTDDGTLSDMNLFLRGLPNSNFQIIKHMISHFVKIAEKSSVNSMDSKNLAICWWPTLLQFEFNDMDFFEQKRPHLMNFVQIMIDSNGDLFSNSNQDNSNNEISMLANSEDNLANLSCSADELSSL